MRYPNGLPLLDPVEDMNIKDDPQLMQAVTTINTLEQQLVKNPGDLDTSMPLPALCGHLLTLCFW